MEKIILVPRLNNPGGVAVLYTALKPFLGQEVKYISRGKKKNKNIFIRLLSDYYNFVIILYKPNKLNCIIINSSLGKSGFIRDGFYNLLISKQKIIVFYHGWNPEFEKIIDKSRLLKFWLKCTFLKANHIIVLSSNFKDKLREWGYEGGVSIGTTLVDEKLVENFDLQTVIKDRYQKFKIKELLYLGNVARGKGVWEIVSAFKYLNGKKKYSNLKFTIAGSGKEVDGLKKFASVNNLPVNFPGYVIDNTKMETFLNASLYVFASYHEGMPLSVLEAMALGLPILTTRVGGIPDFFEEAKMGLFLDNREPEHIAEKIEYLLDRPELMKEMSEYNYNYAKEHFYASKVAARLEKLIDDVVEGKE